MVKQTRAIRCDFYSVEIPDEEKVKFTDALVMLSDLPDDESRVAELPRRQPIKLDHAELHDSLWLLDMVRIRMDVEPKRASKRGPIKAMRLEEDKGMAEE